MPRPEDPRSDRSDTDGSDTGRPDADRSHHDASDPVRSRPRTGPNAESLRRRWWVPAGIVAATAALVGGVLWVQPSEREDRPRSTGTVATGTGAAIEHPSEVAAPDLSAAESRDPEDLLAEGPVDAPVVIVVFTDFQCTYCAKWSHDTLPTMREYVDRGEVRIEFRDVNIYGEDSERAARASLAAARQGAHAEYHAALFPQGTIRSPEQLSEEALVELAGSLGLDVEQFGRDLDSEAVRATIDQNAQLGIELGAMSTPAFVIGGTPVVGAQPTEVFVDLVDDAIAERGA